MRRVLLITAGLLAAMLSPASAQMWGATADGDYFNLAGVPGYDANAAVNIPFDWHSMSAQLNMGDHSVGPDHDFDIGGNAIWNDPDGDLRVAATGIYNHDVLLGARINETQLGAGAEWYPTAWLTVGGQGGGVAGKLSGGYVDGTLKVYPFDDIGIGGTVDYVGLSTGGTSINETDYGVKGEWLVSETFPLAVTSGYTHVRLSGGALSASTDVWSIGLKFYVNEFGAGPLVQRNRTGTLDTIGPIHPALFSY